MKTYLALSVLLATTGLAGATIPLPPSNWLPAAPQERVQFVSGCESDEDVAADKREAIDAVAMAYARTILASKPDEAFSTMTALTRSDEAHLKEVKVLTDAVHSTTFSDVKIDHTYLVTAFGSGHDVYSACAPRIGMEHIAAGTKLGWTQAHVLISARTKNNEWTFALWLMHEESGWHVQYFYFGASGIAGRSSEDLLKLAREQDDRGHALNAEALYVGADLTSNRGSAIGLPVKRALHDDLAKFKPAPEVDGKPPFTWMLGGASYKVAKVSIMGIGDELGLTFDLPMDAWKDNQDADKRNRAFLDAFRAAHPEYAEVFSFLDARAQKPDGSGGFSTVYDNKSGFR